jgi:hypothetical protein
MTALHATLAAGLGARQPRAAPARLERHPQASSLPGVPSSRSATSILLTTFETHRRPSQFVLDRLVVVKQWQAPAGIGLSDRSLWCQSERDFLDILAHRCWR